MCRWLHVHREEVDIWCRWLHVHREEVDICVYVATCTSRGGRYLCMWLHVHREEVDICVGGYMYIERR